MVVTLKVGDFNELSDKKYRSFAREALAEGAVIVPNIIFAGLLYQHYGQYHFLLPFVLLYSFEKAGVFAIQGFGELKNPYKVLRYSLLLAILGTCLCLFGDFSFLFWELGAVLIGLGLANYKALFKTIKSMLKEKMNGPIKEQ